LVVCDAGQTFTDWGVNNGAEVGVDSFDVWKDGSIGGWLKGGGVTRWLSADDAGLVWLWGVAAGVE